MTTAQLLKLPLKVLRLEQNSPRWLEVRKKFRTASETPIVLGISPWTTPGELAMVKYGNSPAFEGNRATEHGHKWEPAARRAYEKKFGRVMKPCCVTRGPFMASLDGWSKDRRIVLEIKNPFSGTNGHTWRSASNGEVEPHYYTQIMHQIMVCGAERCDFEVFDSKSETFQLIEVSRNEDEFQTIIDAWEAFEKRYA